MNNTDLLGPWLKRFLVEHIVIERNLARLTQKSYRDTFNLLLPYVCTELGKHDDRLAVRDITSELVLQFLTHLENDRECSVRTRNQRLAAIRAFARFVGSRDATHIEWCGQIRGIPWKKYTPPAIGWLTKEEMDAMLDVANRESSRGRVEYALLLFLYNTGARVSEVTQLRVGDLQLGRPGGGHALATLNGKGGKIRRCPLFPETEHLLEELVHERAATDAVFLSRHGKPYTRFGVYRLVERLAAQVPELSGRKITPHVLRHTLACHLFRSKIDINTVRAWLGHSSINTTNIYTEVDLEMTAEAVALCDAAEREFGPSWKEDQGLMAFLKSL